MKINESKKDMLIILGVVLAQRSYRALERLMELNVIVAREATIDFTDKPRSYGAQCLVTLIRRQ